MSIYNYSDDPRHDLEIYEQEQEKMDKRAERLEQLTKEAEEMYRTEELGEVFCYDKEAGYGAFSEHIALALKDKNYEIAGLFMAKLVDTYAPILAKEYAEKVLENEEKLK